MRSVSESSKFLKFMWVQILRKIITAILFLFFVCMNVQPASAAPSGILARSALVVHKNSGKTLFSRRARQIMPPASTVKLLTALTALDEVSLDQAISIRAAATSAQPSKLHLRAGEAMYVRDLIRAILISSANDAAKAIAIGVSGSESSFAEKMNAKARSLGVRHSNFMNASGLPQENQYSTAEDMLKIMQAAEKVPFFVEVMKVKETHIRTIGGRRFYLKNHNKMLWRDSRQIIGKTGWTRNAKHCFAGRMGSGSNAVYVVVMGSKNKWKDLARLADLYVSKRGHEKVSSSKTSSKYDVFKIQSALRKAGFFKREPTGYFGPITKRAVVKFQKANQLTPDGIVGPQTWKKLSNYL